MTLEETISQLGSEDVDIHGGTFNGGYRLQQNPAELAWMIEQLQKIEQFDLYGEIGLGSGGTFRVVAELAKPIGAVVIDDAKQPYSVHVPENLRASGCPCWWIKGDSHCPEVAGQLADEMRTTFPFAFDALLIDGDHSYAGVTQDVELVRPYCRPYTLLFFHDIALVNYPGCEVPRFWRESRLIERRDEFVAPPSKSGHQLGIGLARLAC